MFFLLQWRYNERHVVSNHWRLDYLLSRLFRRRSKKTSKLCATGLCEENPLLQRVSNAENFSIWWHHHVIIIFPRILWGRTGGYGPPTPEVHPPYPRPSFPPYPRPPFFRVPPPPPPTTTTTTQNWDFSPPPPTHLLLKAHPTLSSPTILTAHAPKFFRDREPAVWCFGLCFNNIVSFCTTL